MRGLKRQAGRLIILGAIVCVCADGSPPGTKNRHWISRDSGLWQGARNWAPPGVPSPGDNVYIKNVGSKTITIDSTTAAAFPDSLVINSLQVSAHRESVNALSLSGSGTEVPLRVLRDVIIEKGGAISVRDAAMDVSQSLLVGGTGSGDFVVANGNVRAANMVIDADGLVTVYEGRAQVESLTICTNANAHGELMVLGGTFAVGSDISSGFLVGNSEGCTGRVTVAGGELIVTNTATFVGSVGHGWINVSRGRVG